ncbi:MAG TPA: two-component regulator propeller domain-containing protein [Prolixibacteraceae bacterium]|nr:two-component regulator propeller domain-containing protein [Prolixibacteraceae bacterium]
MSRVKVNKILFFLLCGLLLFFHSLGQAPVHIEFDHYTTREGLSNGYINTFLQDSRGFMWVGTSNGLNRFDGISFKSYSFNPKDPGTIPGSSVNAMVEDKLGNMWVMTNNGLCVYDRKKDRFSRKIILINGKRYSDYYLYSCLIDSEGYLWVSIANHEIFRFNIYTNPEINYEVINAEMYEIDEPDVDGIYKNNVFAMVEDKDGKIWLTSNSKNLFYLDRAKNQFIPYPINHPEAQRFSNKRKGLLKDSSGDLFVSIEYGGLLWWNRKNDVFSLYKPSAVGQGPHGNVLFALAEDANGLIWIGDRNSEGVSIFDKNTRTFTYTQSDKLDPYSLITNKINCIYRDHVGAMWVGTIIGINKYSPGKSKFKRYISNEYLPDKLSYNNTLCFAEGKNDIIWIGTDGGGINRLDRKTGKFSSFTHEKNNPNSLSSNAVISACEDHEGVLWMGTFHGGLVRMKNGQFKAYLPDRTNPYSNSSRNIWYVYEDSKLNLWVATLGNGLQLFDRKNERFYHYTFRAEDSTSLCNNSINGLFEDSKGHLYITTNHGVSILDLNAYDFSRPSPELKFKNLVFRESKNSLSSNNVYCGREDNEGIVWFGNIAAGLDRFDPVSGQFTNYSIKDGLPGNSITSILVDDRNNLWVATDKGLVKFNTKTNKMIVFDTKDGLQNKSLKGWALKTRDGEMFLGGPDGFNSFYPETLRDNQNPNKPDVMITGLKIFNTNVKTNEKFNDRIVLTNDIAEINELLLTHEENFFSFEFIALDYTTPEKNKYAYKMEGFDQEWVECGTKREANYTNLDAGEYTFRVKASNNDGIWNEKGTALKVIILPPWWETWWFRSVMAFSVLMILIAAYYMRIRRFKSHEKQLMKMVTQKTYELRQMNSVLIKQAEELNKTNSLLEERQRQIEGQSHELSRQKEELVKMNNELHDLNATKDKFFSIIAHDIKNPFSAIMGFSALLEENYKEWNDEMKLEVINLVHVSTKNLYQLLENLLQWSRSQRGTIEFKPQRIELKELIHNVTGLMNGTADAKNIDLEIMLAENAVAVNADRQMLDTILRNLIGNGVKFTHSGGKVQIISEAVNDFVKIHVIDNGVGMNDDVKKNLFRIDTNFTLPGTNNEIGTGLGLILVKEFVEKHGGTIDVESEPGKGSRFHFTLPAAKTS